MNQTSVINEDSSANGGSGNILGSSSTTTTGTTGGTSVKRPMTLSREVLRWLQSLDLAYSIKNTKRDFCNGFLIAEIFSRYYDKDITMHSYDNGTGVKIRKDNWMQLSKFFKRKNLHHIINTEEINSIINCEDNAVVIFINRIYEVLTHRRVQDVIKRSLPDQLPAYARNTSSYLISQTAKTLENQDIEDDLTKSMKLQETMEEFEQSHQDERQENTDRFMSHTTKPIDAPPKMDVLVPTVTVKDIQVKQIEGNAAQLRATRELGNTSSMMSGMMGSSSQSQSQQQSGVPPETSVVGLQPPPETAPSAVEAPTTAALDGTEMPPEPLKNPDIITFLNTTLNKEITQDEQSTWDDNRDMIWCLVSSIVEESISIERGIELLGLLTALSTDLAITFSATPKEFWKVFDVLQPLIFEIADGSAFQIPATNLLIAIGTSCLNEDPTIASTLTSDYLFPKIVTALRTISYPKIHNFLKIMYSFISNDSTSHIYTLKKIQTSLDDNNLFLQTLTNIIYLEEDFSEALVDMYLYYSIMGLGNTSPSLRAASIAMISILADKSFESVVELLSQLINMAEEDKWWEIQAQLLVASSAILTEVGEWIDHPGIVEQLLSIVSSCFSKTANLNVRKIGLSVLAPHIKNANSLEDLFLSVLQTIPDPDRSTILGLESGDLSLPLLGSKMGLFMVENIGNLWESLEIAQIISQQVKTQKLETLERDQLQIILCCVKFNNDHFEGDGLSQQFVEYFETMKDYIYVALCDSTNCNLAIDIIKCYLYKSILRESVIKENQFLSILKLLYPKPEGDDEDEVVTGDPICQGSIETFLIDCIKGGGNEAIAVEELYNTLKTKEMSTLLVEKLAEVI